MHPGATPPDLRGDWAWLVDASTRAPGPPAAMTSRGGSAGRAERVSHLDRDVEATRVEAPAAERAAPDARPAGLWVESEEAPMAHHPAIAPRAEGPERDVGVIGILFDHGYQGAGCGRSRVDSRSRERGGRRGGLVASLQQRPPDGALAARLGRLDRNRRCGVRLDGVRVTVGAAGDRKADGHGGGGESWVVARPTGQARPRAAATTLLEERLADLDLRGRPELDSELGGERLRPPACVANGPPDRARLGSLDRGVDRLLTRTDGRLHARKAAAAHRDPGWILLLGREGAVVDALGLRGSWGGERRHPTDRNCDGSEPRHATSSSLRGRVRGRSFGRGRHLPLRPDARAGSVPLRRAPRAGAP